MNLKKRFLAKTPKFWKNMQKIGLTLAGVSAVVLASPVALPVALVTAAGYLATAGSVIGVLSQLTVEDTNQIK
jgi:hypothetical protein